MFVSGVFRGQKVESDCKNISKRTALDHTINTYPLRKKIIHNNKLGHYTFCTNCKLLQHCLSQLNLYSSWNYHPEYTEITSQYLLFFDFKHLSASTRHTATLAIL